MKPINVILSIGKLARPLAIALPLALASLSSSAQSANYDTSYDTATGNSWLPWTSHGYIGVNLGQARTDDNHCAAGFSCDDPNLSGSIYTGGMFNKNFGVELGYVDMGKFDQNGGDIKAHGVNISLVGNIPLGQGLDIFGKVGTTYGWTKTRAAVGPTGDEDGWKPSVGIGVGYDLTARTQFLIEWDRHRFDTVAGDSDIDLYTVGLKYRF